MAKKAPVPKLALGFSLLFLGVLIFIGKTSEQLPKSSSFKTEPVEIELFSEKDYDETKLPRRIIIPELNIDLEVDKSEIVEGYWEVFEDKAGWGVGSGIPGEPGNQVIFAHAREGLFLPLRSIKEGQKIFILTKSKWYRYEVKEIKEVYPNQVEVIAPTQDETLTLYTCSGFADTKRLIVVAKPV